MIESLVKDRELQQVCCRLKRPPRKPKKASCGGCGNNGPEPIDVNELKRWMAEVIADSKRDLIKKKFNTNVLEIRYRNKRGKSVFVKL